MRRAWALLQPAALATVVLVVLLAVKALPTPRVLAIWIVVLAALALLALMRGLPKDEPRAGRRFEQALRARPRPPASRQPYFLAMERELEGATSHAGQAHRRLLPLLRAAASARLNAHHGIELERRPDVARKLLGGEAWEFLRPDRPAPVDPFGPGLSRETIARLVERVEAL